MYRMATRTRDEALLFFFIMLLIIEQILNGLQLGITLFLLSAGLTLVFGIMQVINLAHGFFYMIGAYVGAMVAARTGSFLLALPAAIGAAALVGAVVEILILRHPYKREHLDQVLAILIVDKNIDALMALADHHYIMEKGIIAWHGSTDELQASPHLRSRYLGV